MERYKDYPFRPPEQFKSLGSFQRPRKKDYQNPNEQGKNENAFRQLAKLSGRPVRALPVVQDGKKNPDGLLLDTGQLVDVKVFDDITTKSAIGNAIKKANKQGVTIVLIDARAGASSFVISKGLYHALSPDMNRLIQKVVVLLPQNELKVYDASVYRKIRKGKH